MTVRKAQQKFNTGAQLHAYGGKRGRKGGRIVCCCSSLSVVVVLVFSSPSSSSASSLVLLPLLCHDGSRGVLNATRFEIA